MVEYPRLIASCSFHVYDNGGGSEEYVLATADGRQFKISGLARRILTRLDGKTPIDRIAADLNAESIPITPDQLRDLLDRKYSSLGVIEDGREPALLAVTTRTLRRLGFP